MTEHKVEINDRQRRRHRKKAVKNYLKGLAELITNSDGSYQNLENKKQETNGEITIIIDRVLRTFEVIDNAEGLSKQNMIEIFTQTGAKHKTHRKGGRSLFGKGLPDTLFSPIIEIGSGEVHSIKESKYVYAKFRKNKMNEEVVDIKPDNNIEQKVTTKIRRDLKIKEGNGTVVRFKLAEKTTFPRDDTLVRDLTKFYMLRFINQNPNRKIKIKFSQEGKLKYETGIKYHEPKDIEQIGEKLNSKFKFKNYPEIDAEGSLYKTQKSLRGHSPFGLEKREGGLLIFDEYNNVMDLQLFSFDEDPNAKYYYGYLKLKGAYEIIRDYMDKEDEEILTDTRDGFDRRHPFYRGLKKIVDKWLKKIIGEDQLEETRDSFLSKETIERQKEAFKKLNELYEKINTDSELLLGDEEGKKEGLDFPLEFSIRTAKLILGKKYKIRLSADTDLVQKQGKVEVTFNPKEVIVSPKTIIIKKPKTGKIYSEYIEITPLKITKNSEIIATYSEDIKTNLNFEIVEEEYYKPKEILEFYPKKIIAPPVRTKSVNLYVDLTRVEGNKIFINSDSKELHLSKKEYNLGRRLKIIDNIAKILIPVKGLKEGTFCQIQATCDNAKDIATIEVRNPKEERKSLEIFNDWTYKPLDSKFQIWPNKATKKMDINSNHPINQLILGKTKEEAELNFESFPHCQLLVGELILTEFLKSAFFDARESGAIRDPSIKLDRYIQEEKFNLGEEILGLFVKKDQIEKLKILINDWAASDPENTEDTQMFELNPLNKSISEKEKKVMTPIKNSKTEKDDKNLTPLEKEKKYGIVFES